MGKHSFLIDETLTVDYFGDGPTDLHMFRCQGCGMFTSVSRSQMDDMRSGVFPRSPITLDCWEVTTGRMMEGERVHKNILISLYVRENPEVLDNPQEPWYPGYIRWERNL